MTDEEIAELLDMNAALNTRVKQLESLLGRIHKATDQFYTKQKEARKPDPTPYKDIIDLYHLILPDLPKVEKATEKRKAAMRQRWSDDLVTLEDWTLYFKDERQGLDSELRLFSARADHHIHAGGEIR
jgi:hypothetical protein